MINKFSRTELLIGKSGVNRLNKARIAVFGIGGVGGYVCEALARSGVGEIDIIDNDTVSLTNINRQIIATTKTVGKNKVDVMEERMKEINPDVVVNKFKCFFLPENASEFQFDRYDYVVDAVDTVTAKLELIMKCKEMNVPIISCMGAGNKLDATEFKVADISETKVCPLAKVMRRELKKRGITNLKVVYSEEKALTPIIEENNVAEKEKTDQQPEYESKGTAGRMAPGSIAYVPAVAGLIIAGEVIKDISIFQV